MSHRDRGAGRDRERERDRYDDRRKEPREPVRERERDFPGRERDREYPSSRGATLNEFFVDGEGIHREVMQRELCKYLGPDALSRPGTYNVRLIRAACPVVPILISYPGPKRLHRESCAAIYLRMSVGSGHSNAY